MVVAFTTILPARENKITPKRVWADKRAFSLSEANIYFGLVRRIHVSFTPDSLGVRVPVGNNCLPHDLREKYSLPEFADRSHAESSWSWRVYGSGIVLRESIRLIPFAVLINMMQIFLLNRVFSSNMGFVKEEAHVLNVCMQYIHVNTSQ